MKNYIFILLAFILLTSQLNAQTMVYDITSKNNHLGQLSITKTQEKDLIKIEATSEVKVHLFISIDLKYKLTANYRNDSLIFSSVTTYVNGKLHSSRTTEKTGENYSVTKDGHLSKLYYPISYSGALLYWQEPINVANVYSEFDSIEKPIEVLGPGTYKLTDPKSGHLSKYYYSNGRLVKATIEHTLMSFTLTKR